MCCGEDGCGAWREVRAGILGGQKDAARVAASTFSWMWWACLSAKLDGENVCHLNFHVIISVGLDGLAPQSCQRRTCASLEASPYYGL